MFQWNVSWPDLKALWQSREGRRLLLGGTAVLVLAIVTLAILWGPSQNEGLIIPLEEETQKTSTQDEAKLVIDIGGGVARPGVYRLPSGSIVEDAILLAGGFSSSADLRMVEQAINRAELLQNHSKLYIPKIGDQLPASAPLAPAPSSPLNSLTSSPASLVNINSASLAELDTLPGIGPATAQNIIDFRQANGAFRRKEDLKLVPGIGESKYEKIKELIAI